MPKWSVPASRQTLAPDGRVRARRCYGPHARVDTALHYNIYILSCKSNISAGLLLYSANTSSPLSTDHKARPALLSHFPPSSGRLAQACALRGTSTARPVSRVDTTAVRTPLRAATVLVLLRV